jgi:hypothetical protein
MKCIIDVYTYDDYDKVIEWLLSHDVAIKSKNKVKMVIVTRMSDKLAKQIRGDIDCKESLVIRMTEIG